MTEQDELVVLQRAKEKFPERDAADHQRQRLAVLGQGLQGVHSHLRDDARRARARTIRRATANWSDFTAASRASASAPARRSRWKTRADRGPIRGALQPGPLAQRHRLRCAGGQIGRPRGGNLRRPRPQTGRGARAEKGATRGSTLADGCLTEETRYDELSTWAEDRALGDATRAPTQGL